ncbi:hypothetical protein Acr_01g0011540 [Actinidia rufa]|uniref:Uncharacterized protein n=1 Tax=Actinidia rufa TaxID=165716 RepID=A0A7J0E4P2_9ERIC|nr:hypothetical protein Acr_01g0011540 [Actinidia rufa]
MMGGSSPSLPAAAEMGNRPPPPPSLSQPGRPFSSSQNRLIDDSESLSTNHFPNHFGLNLPPAQQLRCDDLFPDPLLLYFLS